MVINEDIFDDYGIPIYLKDNESFLKIKETLTRIGIASKHEKKLYQSCHILHKQGQYAIMHFKEMMELDGKETNITDNDLERRNTIVKLLQQWNLLDVVDEEDIERLVPINQIKIISFKEKNSYELITKYTFGRSKK